MNSPYVAGLLSQIRKRPSQGLQNQRPSTILRRKPRTPEKTHQVRYHAEISPKCAIRSDWPLCTCFTVGGGMWVDGGP